MKPIRITIYDPTQAQYYSALKILPYADGGFGLILPQLDSSVHGRLEKMYIYYEDYGTRLKGTRDDGEQYEASDIVKLSYHNDGFVQFSSATNYKIRSGKNSDGSPKGLGVQSWALSDPITTGPSVVMSMWDLGKFKPQPNKKIDTRFIFRTDAASSEYAYKGGGGPRDLYVFEIYVLPNSKGEVEKSIVKTGTGEENAYMSMAQNTSASTFFIRLRTLIRIVRLPNSSVVLGISWRRFNAPDREPKFGYILCGPSDGKRFLMASYPEGASGNQSVMKSIMFNPEEESTLSSRVMK